MKPDSRDKFVRSRFLFFTILITEMVIAGIIVGTYYASSKAAYKKDVENKFENALNLITTKVDSYVSTLKGVSAVYLTRDFKISNNEVRKYAKFRNYFQRMNGSLGFGFIRYVKEKDLKHYVLEMQKNLGKDNFTVSRLSDTNYGDYIVIEAMEPMENNKKSLGFDVGSEQKRRTAAMLAVDTGLPVISEQIKLVQLKSKENGFLIFLPLYEDGTTPNTIEERRKKIKGWACAPITVANSKGFLIGNIDPSIKFEFYIKNVDGSWENILNNTVLKSYQFEKKFKVAEREWLFRANYERKGFELNLEIVSIIGFFIFVFIFTGLSVLVRNLILSNDSKEKRAITAENWISTVINSSHFCIISTDQEGFVSTINKCTEEVVGYKEHEVLGKFVASLLLSNDYSLSNLLKQAKLSGIEMIEGETSKSDGSKFPAKIVVTPVLNETSVLQGFLIVLEDLTEVVKMREELQVKQQQIIATSRLSSLGEMAAGLAHEINNPLSIISSKVHLTLDKVTKKNYDAEMLLDSLTKIDLMVQRIARLVRGLKKLSRDATADPLTPISLMEVINDSIGFCEEKFKQYGISIRVDEFNDLKINCRPSQLVQVFVNLLNNAMDAVENASERWLRIKVQQNTNFVRIEVIDSGGGVSPDIAEKILDPFFTTKETGRGTGLGLSISKTIIAEHKGHLFYDSTARHTTFVVELPLSQNSDLILTEA